MSEEQLSILLAKLQEDAGLQEKLKGASDLDAVVEMAQEAGFDVSKEDWLKHQAKQARELSDEELEGVAGGKGDGGTQPGCTGTFCKTCNYCHTGRDCEAQGM